MSREGLGHFELLVLLAVMRLDDEAYGVPIAEAMADAVGREVLVGSVYAALTRLEAKGLVTSMRGEPTAARGGRAKRYFRVTRAGVCEARVARRAFEWLWRGVPAMREV